VSASSICIVESVVGLRSLPTSPPPPIFTNSPHLFLRSRVNHVVRREALSEQGADVGARERKRRAPNEPVLASVRGNAPDGGEGAVDDEHVAEARARE